MAMMGGNGVGSGAYYRYMDKILDGIYVNNMAKADTPEKIKFVTDYVRSAKSYILNKLPWMKSVLFVDGERRFKKRTETRSSPEPPGTRA